MIAFGVAIMDPEAYRRYAQPGVERTVEPGAELYVFAAVGSVCRSYNMLLERAAEREDLEALVLVDQAVEIADPDFCAKVREALADPDVGVAGCLGATGVQTAAWWDGAVNGGRVVHRYPEFGGGEVEAYAWARAGTPPAEVETVDGCLLVLSPWAVRNLRFDEQLHLGVGFDVDFCRRVREAGRKVTTADLHVVYHRSIELIEDHTVWVEGHVDLGEKWSKQFDGDWKARARRAEAERDAARALAYSSMARLEARLLPLDRELSAMTETPGWRLTAPLRRLNHRRRRLVR